MAIIDEFVWRWSAHKSIAGIDVAFFFLSKAELATATENTPWHVELLHKCDPRRMTYLQRDVKRILVAGSPDFLGAWHQEQAMCELYEKYVLSPDTTPAILAATLAHEAMHARLMRWGFGYEESIRVRIEGICIKASISFARRLPLSEMASRGNIIWTAKQLQDQIQFIGATRHDLKPASWRCKNSDVRNGWPSCSDGPSVLGYAITKTKPHQKVNAAYTSIAACTLSSLSTM